MQCKTRLSITRTTQGTSHEKINQVPGIESLKSRRWQRRLSCMFKIMGKEAPNYLVKLITTSKQTIRVKNNHIASYNCSEDCVKYSFFLFTLNDWSSLNDNIRNSESLSIFKSNL